MHECSPSPLSYTQNINAFLQLERLAKKLAARGGGLFLVGPFLWGWIVFIFGIAGLALYWAIHHSSLRSSVPPQDRLNLKKEPANDESPPAP